MKNTFGNSISLTLFGESHGEAIGVVIDGLCPGLSVSNEYIEKMLSRRRPSSSLDTARREKDEFRILSGVVNGKSTGTPICIVIPNEDKNSSDYRELFGKARPSHADYTAYCKYHGFEDSRGGGHFSGRLTAALVAAGGIFIPALENLGIGVGTHIKRCAKIDDREFDNLESDIKFLADTNFPALDKDCGDRMSAEILKAREALDSVGGVTETAVYGLPSGLGEPWFDSVEGVLSHALFSLGGVKGVEFGMGFDIADSRASECNDEMQIVDGKVVSATNNNGGICGGITNGMPMIFRCAIKPTPSIAREQKTVDFIKNENTSIKIKGRHDPAIVRRICPVINSLTAFVICDMLSARYGTDILQKGREAF